MVPTLRFPFTFDVAALRADLDRFGPEDWTPHFNTRYYEGDWSVVPLRAPKGAVMDIFPDPSITEFVETKHMARCTYVPKVVELFQCPLETVRFMKLGAGAVIKEHRDFGLCLEGGSARIHIPVRTSADVAFRLGGEDVPMAEGEAWYLNFDLPHSVENRGSRERVHLVIDCLVDDWLLSYFPPIGS